jgi:TP901-1 family phage major tail protein
MAKATGRELIIKRSGTKIAAVTSKTVTINNEAIDVTNDDDAGYRTLLEASGMRSVDIAVEGVYDGDDLIAVAAAASPTLITADTVQFPSGATITGNFRFNDIETSGEHDGRVEFSANLQSSGTFTFTP